MSTATRLAVVLPVHNRRDTTLRALRSLEASDLPGIQLQIIVVDAGSTDGTGEAVRLAHPAVQVITGTGSLFYAGGTNAGIAVALGQQPDFVVIANDDTVFSHACLRELVACAHRHPGSVIGALLLRWDVPHLVFQVGQTWDTHYGGWRVPRQLTAFTVPDVPWMVESLAGNCVLVPAEAFRQSGVLAVERFPHHWADAEFSARLRRAGRALLVAPRARVFCQPNTYPPSLQSLSLGRRLEALFRNRYHPMHLPGQWRMRWHTAPRRSLGALAAATYTLRLGLRWLGVGTWPDWPDPPLGPTL